MTKQYAKIKVLIADDHQMVREGLQLMAKKIEELEIIGEACNGEELVQMTRELLPEVILTDIKMPRMNGVEATRLIKKDFPHIGVLALSSYDEENLILDMLNAGAKGYLLKNTGKKELAEAVSAAYRDEPYYSKEIKQKLAELISAGGYLTGKGSVRSKFTDREMEVIEWVCKGLISKEIAAQMSIATRTVERYRDSIMEKMEVKNAASIVAYAIEHGLYKPVKEKK